MKRLITNTEIETVIKKLATNKSPGPDSFTGKFYQALELTPILLNLFQKISEEGTLSKSFHEATITLAIKDATKKLLVNITDEYRCKNPQQNTSKLNPTLH